MKGENQEHHARAYVRNVRRVGLACMIAGVYLVVFGVVYSFVYRSQIAAARRI